MPSIHPARTLLKQQVSRWLTRCCSSVCSLPLPSARADECSCEGPQMKSKTRKRGHLIGSMLGLTLLAAADQWAWAAGPQTRGPERIEHIVIIYLENRSFDNLYGYFPGANGRSEERRVGKECRSRWSP